MDASPEPLFHGVWYNGTLLLASNGAALPPLCVDCGTSIEAPSRATRYRALRRKSPARFLFKRIAQPLATLMFGNSVMVGAGVCPPCVAARKRTRVVAAFLFLLLPVVAISLTKLGVVGRSAAVWVCAGTAFAMLVALSVATGKRKPLEVFAVENDGLGYFFSAGDRFLTAARSYRDTHLLSGGPSSATEMSPPAGAPTGASIGGGGVPRSP